MAVETSQAILTAIRTRLRADSSLQTTLGGTFSVYRWPNLPNDPALPYWTHRLALGQEFLHGTHTYWLDLYYYGTDSAVVDAAIDRARILFHEWRFTTASDEATGAMKWFSGDYIPTDNPLVWHFATQWTVRFGAARDINNIVG